VSRQNCTPYIDIKRQSCHFVQTSRDAGAQTLTGPIAIPGPLKWAVTVVHIWSLECGQTVHTSANCLNTTRETRRQKRLVKLKRLAQGSSILAALVMIRCHNEVQVGYQLLEAQRGTLGQSSTAIWPCRRTSMSVSDHSSFASLPTHVRQPPVRVIGERGSNSPSGTTGR